MSNTLSSEDKANLVCKWMVDGQSDVETSQLILENILFTTSMNSSIVDVQALKTARYINDAVDVVMKYDIKRLEKGMNPNTLMTEYRRKVILQALASSSNDDGNASRNKLQLYEKNRDKFNGAVLVDKPVKSLGKLKGSRNNEFVPCWSEEKTKKWYKTRLNLMNDESV